MRFTGPFKRSCNSSYPSTLLFKIWKNGKTLLYKQQQMVQNGIILIHEHLLNDFQKTQFYSCMDYMLAKNVCDILIIKYKCYCKQAMKQMVSWILQYSHIFQLKFTAHQSGSFKSWLYCVSPQPLSIWTTATSDAGSAALGAEPRHKSTSSTWTHYLFPTRNQNGAQIYPPQKHGMHEVGEYRCLGKRIKRWKNNCPAQGSKGGDLATSTSVKDFLCLTP